MLIAEFKPEVGMRVRTNGDGAHRKISRYIEGVISEVRNKFFFVDHNDPEFESDNYNSITDGYKYAWCIGLNNNVAQIEELTQYKQKIMPNFLKNLSVALKKFLDAPTKTQLEAGFRDETLALTKDGRWALLEILAQANADALTASAQAVLDERAVEEAKNKK